MLFFKKKIKHIDTGDIDPSRVPQHVGIIMDGNGRWAKRRGMPRSVGHKAGVDTLERIADYCNAVGVKALTVYAFSTENWKRSAEEVGALMNLFYHYLTIIEEKFRNRNIKLRFSGDTAAFSDKLQKAIDHAVEVTSSGDGMILNVAMNYGGRDEIVRAARSAADAVSCGEITLEGIDEEYFGKLLYTANLPEVDLIIRPSGEQRLSNFLLWQAAYAEFWYSDICWPDFSEQDMKQAIIDYQNRSRRFGA